MLELLWLSKELSFFLCPSNYEDDYVFLILVILLSFTNEPLEDDFLSPTGLLVNSVVNEDFGFPLLCCPLP